jgi:uncharacterized membrane protein YjfL (UPF0719 family)
MKTPALLTLVTSLFAAAPSFAADAVSHETWHPSNLGQAVLYMVIFAALGIGVAIVGYKIFDKFTPGNLHKEIIEKQNVAAAIIAGAVVIGICLVVAAAIVG